MKYPSILISNDDGIYSDGIYALWEAMSEIGNTTVVAPNTEKSAVGHAITLSDPIRIQKIKRVNGFKGFSVHGTPADSVKIAVKAIMDSRPDLIISGINTGANVGQSLLYSGTISAATEGTFLGIPSIAISLNAYKKFDFSGTKGFDNKHNYRSKSFLTIPLKNHKDKVIGILQLLNASIPTFMHSLISFKFSRSRFAACFNISALKYSSRLTNLLKC